MNTCKDCLCYAACSYHITEETAMTVNECATGFKNKEEYTKLPAYVGQPVWVLISYWGKPEILIGKVSMLQQKADKSWKIRVSRNGSVSDYTIDDFGNTLFFNADDAAKALIEYLGA